MSETITDRELAARRFAEAVGWAWVTSNPDVPAGNPYFWIQQDWKPDGSGKPLCLFLPKPDAPLHEHLAFVGRVAEVCPNASVIVFAAAEALMRDADMSHAALLAALSALGARAGK